MEGDEKEMSKEELQNWIREKVKKTKFISTDVLQKCNQLQFLLERRERQAAHLLKLCESVAACEAIVKKQYSLLGWEYRDTDSDDEDDDDDDDNITGCGNTLSCPKSSTTNGPSCLLPKLQDSESLDRDNGNKSSIRLKTAVVVLTRLSTCKISSLCPPTLQSHCSEDESVNGSDSDMQWEPDDDSSDSDFSVSGYNTGTNKRRKIDQKNEKLAKRRAKPPATTNSNAKSDVTKTSPPPASADSNAKSEVTTTSPPPASADSNAKSEVTKTSPPPASADSNAKSEVTKTSPPPASADSNAKSEVTKTSPPPASADSNAKSKVTKTSQPPASADSNAKINAAKPSTLQAKGNTNAKSNATQNAKGVNPVCKVSTLCKSTDEANKSLPSVPQGEICVNMNVLARRKAMRWQQGKVIEIVTKEDGRLKYKISFEGKGKSLVSGHHIAFDYMPKAEQLFVGTRMVVKCQADQPQFCPGVLAEVPSRKNRMRFLVFIDDHTPVYVGLPLLHQVYRPLTDPLDDIPDGTHKNFLKQYIKAWPYPPQTQYRVGQIINAEFNGVQQRCEVLQVDCSLIQVVFEKDKHKEWIYRGSLRLEHMINMIEHLESKKDKKKNKSV